MYTSFFQTLTNCNVEKAVKSHIMSKRYIITVLRTSVINIFYHRLNIDKREFIDKKFNNVPFKSYRSTSKNKTIMMFYTYMAACKDAIEKNYVSFLKFHKFYSFFDIIFSFFSCVMSICILSIVITAILLKITNIRSNIQRIMNLFNFKKVKI